MPSKSLSQPLSLILRALGKAIGLRKWHSDKLFGFAWGNATYPATTTKGCGMIGTLKSFVGRAARRIKRTFQPEQDRFLKKVSGVIHIGANSGQERETYEKLGLNVIWVEAIPDVFDELAANIESYPAQRAFCYLLTDRDGAGYDFKIASNSGQSSSIFDLALHRDIWPEIDYVATISLTSTAFSTMIERERVDLAQYEALVLDTQGSELLVIKGAGDLIRRFRYIKTEAADFEAYKDGCLLAELKAYLAQHGFVLIAKRDFAKRESGGVCCDVVFERR